MDLILKMVKFGIVGFIGMLIDFFITWLLKEKIKINKYIANSLGFTCAVINNFFLNLKWTFHTGGSNTNIFFIKFIIISVVGLGLNNMFVYLFHDRLKQNFYVSKALAVVCVFVWNFTTNNYFNFR